MKGTLFSADFVKDASANLRLLEINTDTGFITSQLNSLDLSALINVLSTNTITELVLVYKEAVHWNVIAKIEEIIAANAPFITSIVHQKEDRQTIYPDAVTDGDNKFILRLAYDEAAILDSTYAKNRLNIMNLFTSASGDGTNNSTIEYYHSSSNGLYNTITPTFNAAGFPDAVIKDVDEAFNPIDFYKIGSEVGGESDQERWNAFIAANKAGDKVIEKFSYHTSSIVNSKFTSARVFGIVYGANLDWIDILSYKVPAVLDHPTSTLPEVNAGAYTNKLNDEHFYEYSTNFIKEVNRGVLGLHKFEMADSTYKYFSSASVGDAVKSYFISGSPTLETDEAILTWGVSGSTLPGGSYLTSSKVTNVNRVNLEYGGVVELDVNGDTLYVGAGKDFLVYNSSSNVMSYETAIDLNPEVHYFSNRNGELVDIDAVNFFVSSDTDLTLTELDVEDTDTIIISGSILSNSVVAHNYGHFGYTCFIEGTKILLSNEDEKNIEDVVVGDKVFSYTDGKLVEADVIAIDHRHTVESHAAACKELGDEIGVYTINNSGLLFTPEHPFLTSEGYKSLVPALDQEPYKSEQAPLVLTTGDKVKNINNLEGWETVDSITHFVLPKDTKVYNITVKDTHNYIANKYVVHNK